MRIFVDTMSGAAAQRPELANCMEFLRPGDTLVVWRLDRLGRSVKNLIEVLTELGERGVEFRSVTEGFDTNTIGGKLIFHVLAALAEFERDLLRERTIAGLAYARDQGRKGGRPSVLTDEQIHEVRGLYEQGDLTIYAIAKLYKVGRATIYRVVDDLRLAKEASAAASTEDAASEIAPVIPLSA